MIQRCSIWKKIVFSQLNFLLIIIGLLFMMMIFVCDETNLIDLLFLWVIKSLAPHQCEVKKMIHLTSAIISSSNEVIHEEGRRLNGCNIFNNIICLELDAGDTIQLKCIQLLRSRALENMIYGAFSSVTFSLFADKLILCEDFSHFHIYSAFIQRPRDVR